MNLAIFFQAKEMGFKLCGSHADEIESIGNVDVAAVGDLLVQNMMVIADEGIQVRCSKSDWKCAQPQRYLASWEDTCTTARRCWTLACHH